MRSESDVSYGWSKRGRSSLFSCRSLSGPPSRGVEQERKNSLKEPKDRERRGGRREAG